MMVRLAVVGVKGGVGAHEAGHDTRPRVAYHRSVA